MILFTQSQKRQTTTQTSLQILREPGSIELSGGQRVKLKMGIDQQISMCGKKSNARQGGQEQPRKQFLDNSIFYYEYLNNSLNYILSGTNDLDHAIQFDAPALKVTWQRIQQILSTDATEESVHFVERVKQMKTTCDPGTYLKDVQQYGEFINYEAFRTTHHQNAGIEAELKEEFEIGIKLKRIKKKFKRSDDRLTLCQIQMLDRQIKEEIVNELIEQTQGRKTELDSHLDENKLYREMFNIQEVIKKQEKVQRNEKVELKKEKPKKGPKRTKSDAYIPPSNKYRDAIPSGELGRLVEERVKKEEPVEKYPFRMFTASAPAPAPNFIPLNVPQKAVPPPAIPPTLVEVPAAKVPMTIPNMPVAPIQLPQTPIQVKPIQKMQEQPIKPAKPVEISKPLETTVEKPTIREQNANPASSMTSSAQPHPKTDPEPKKRKQKYIQKEEKSEKGRKRGPKQKSEKEKETREKRPYHKRKQPGSGEQVRYPIAPPIPVPIQNIYVEKRTNQIGIQADANEDLQNLRVLAPRSNAAFVFEPLHPVPPPQLSVHYPQPQERRQPPPERREILPMESINLNSSINLLRIPREMGERFRSVSPARMDTDNRALPGSRTPAPAAYDSLRKLSDAHDRKLDDDFDDIGDYLA